MGDCTRRTHGSWCSSVTLLHPTKEIIHRGLLLRQPPLGTRFSSSPSSAAGILGGYIFLPSPQLWSKGPCRLPFGPLISIGCGSSSWCRLFAGFDLMLPAVIRLSHRRALFPSYIPYRDPVANGSVRDRDQNNLCCLFIPLCFQRLSPIFFIYLFFFKFPSEKPYRLLLLFSIEVVIIIIIIIREGGRCCCLNGLGSHIHQQLRLDLTPNGSTLLPTDAGLLRYFGKLTAAHTCDLDGTIRFFSSFLMDLFSLHLFFLIRAHAGTSIPWRVGNFYLISPRQQLSIQNVTLLKLHQRLQSPHSTCLWITISHVSL